MKPRLHFAWTEISFDPVSVRIDDEGGVVIRSVHWPQTRPTVVPAARPQSCGVKCFDGRCARCRKAHVQARLFVRRNGMLRQHHPECDGFGSIPISGGAPGCSYTPVSERLKSSVVEAAASVDVPDPDRHVSDHFLKPASSKMAFSRSLASAYADMPIIGMVLGSRVFLEGTPRVPSGP
jgi:hypothetical protein